MNHAQLAETFTRHDFAQTYDYFADDIVWNLIGGTPVIGKNDIVATCEQSAKYLAKQKTIFSRFEVIEAEDTVVIDSEAEYKDEADVSSRVASCDIYRFSAGKIIEITSYNIELEA